MENEIVIELERLILEKYKNANEIFSLDLMRQLNMRTYQKWIHELKPVAIQIAQQKKLDKQAKLEKSIEESHLYQLAIQEEMERQRLKKEEEEQRATAILLANRESPDMPLTLQDIREVGNQFDYNVKSRVLDELNVEILKRIVRKQYSHKFT